MSPNFLHYAKLGVFVGALALSGQPSAAVEIRGQVSKAAGDSVEITTDSPLLPQVGDKVEIYIELKTIKSTALVTAGTVAALNGTTIVVKADNPKASVQAGQLAKFASEHPTKRSDAAAPANQPPPNTTTPTNSPPASPAGPVAPPQTSVQKITFDHLKAAGGLAKDAFAEQGVQIVLGPGGEARIERATSAMTLPEGRSQLLMVVQQPRASQFSLAFKQPLHRVSVTRIGVTQGGSLPKWRLTALAANGNALGSTGEDTWGSDARPRTFSVEADGIDQVRIEVDNTWGAGTYATYSCLPIAEIELVPQQAAPPPVPPVAAPVPSAPSPEAPPEGLPGGPVPGS